MRLSRTNLGKELLQSVCEMKAGRRRVHKLKVSPLVAARTKGELSQAQFAQLLG